MARSALVANIQNSRLFIHTEHNTNHLRIMLLGQVEKIPITLNHQHLEKKKHVTNHTLCGEQIP